MRKFALALTMLAAAGLVSADEAVVSNAKLDTSVAPVTQAMSDGFYRLFQGTNLVGVVAVVGGFTAFTVIVGDDANGVVIPGGTPVEDLPSHYGACFTPGC
jgi:hypothetical protein